jgi:hypothetical protein
LHPSKDSVVFSSSQRPLIEDVDASRDYSLIEMQVSSTVSVSEKHDSPSQTPIRKSRKDRLSALDPSPRSLSVQSTSSNYDAESVPVIYSTLASAPPAERLSPRSSGDSLLSLKSRKIILCFGM